jgi:hypothetical protein
MHPYTSGMGPWPGPGTWGIIDKPPSHYKRWPWISEHGIAHGELSNRTERNSSPSRVFAGVPLPAFTTEAIVGSRAVNEIR